MTDAFYRLMPMANLGPQTWAANLGPQTWGRDYMVWDKAASIRYRKPGKGPVSAEFRMADAHFDDIRDKLETLPKCEPTFFVCKC